VAEKDAFGTVEEGKGGLVVFFRRRKRKKRGSPVREKKKERGKGDLTTPGKKKEGIPIIL